VKILIVKLNAIGDVLFATPLAEACRQAWPEAEIHWLVHQHAEPVLRAHPTIDRTILFDGPWDVSLAGLKALERVAFGLRTEQYDLVFCCHRSTAAQLLVHLTGAPQRIGFRGKLARLGYTDQVPFDAAAHETERYLDLLRRVRDEVTNPGMRIGLTEEAQVVGRLIVHQLGQRRPVIGISPGGGRNPGTEMLIKRWPAESFATVGRSLAADGAAILVCGSPDERELCAAVCEGIGEGALSLAGRTDLPQLAGVLARCRVVIANDSGPLHMAAALGVPTVALFGPTDPRLVAPMGPKHRFLWTPPDCGPCYRPDNARSRSVWTCDRAGDELRCLHDVLPQDVLAAVREALVGKSWPQHVGYRRPVSTVA